MRRTPPPSRTSGQTASWDSLRGAFGLAATRIAIARRRWSAGSGTPAAGGVPGAGRSCRRARGGGSRAAPGARPGTRTSGSARGVQRDVLLQHGAQVARADAVAHLRELQRARVARDARCRGSPRVRRRRMPRDSAYSTSREGARARRARSRRSRASARRCGSRPAPAARSRWKIGAARLRADAARRGCSRSLRTNRSLEMLARARGERDARQARGLGLRHAVEGRGDAPLGGDHVRPALEQLRGQARPAPPPGIAGQRRGHVERRGRIAPDERLDRAHRLLLRRARAAARRRGRSRGWPAPAHVVLVAAADASAVAREAERLLRRAHDLVGRWRAAAAPRSRGTSSSRPARRSTGARTRRPRRAASYCGRAGLACGAHAAPEVELPAREEPDAAQRPSRRRRILPPPGASRLTAG